MSDINDMLDNESLFVPSATTKKAPWIVKGEHKGHIFDCQQQEVSVLGKYKAIVYNYRFKIAKENEGSKHTYTDYNTKEEHTVDGKEFVDKEFRASGVFKFLEPKDGDDFESNSEGNKSYYRFCKSIGIEIPKRTLEDGTEVSVLPNLTTDDINGKAVLAVLGDGKPYKNKEGKEVKPIVVKFVKQWGEGVNKDEEIPF